MTRPSVSPLTLGTVQFGIPYGIVNDSGCPDDAEVIRILETAEQSRIAYFDTAAAYGTAEERLGRLLPDERRARWGKITKLPPLEDVARAGDARVLNETVTELVTRSRERLRAEFIDVVMFHRADDVFRLGGAALDALQAEVDCNRVGAMGVSVYSPDEAVQCLTDPRIRHVQIPLNILDRRWMEPPFSRMVAEQPNIVVHVRSAFLQGLLLSPANRWPSWVEEKKELEYAIDHYVRVLGCRNRIDLCLTFTQSVPWVTTTVIGVDTQKQLEMIITSLSGGKFNADQMAMLSNLSAMAAPRLLNPALW